jgi:probable HAF family extracellular repeat protein
LGLVAVFIIAWGPPTTAALSLTSSTGYGIVELSMLGGEVSRAYAINDVGQVAGSAETADGKEHAFLWQDGRMTDLGALGGDQAVAFDVNRHGQAVGGLTTAAGQELGGPGTRAFLWEAGRISPPVLRATPAPGTPDLAPAAAADFEVTEVVESAQRAIRQAGSYRFQNFPLDGSAGQPSQLGEVEIGVGIKAQNPNGSGVAYYDGQNLYTQRPGGSWLVRVPPAGRSEALLDFLETPAAEWELLGTDAVGGRPAHVVERTIDNGPIQTTLTVSIDAATFLPFTLVIRNEMEGLDPFGGESVYADFGGPVDVRPPAAALAPTPTPVPLPETAGGRVEIVSHDIYFEPNEVAIPANADVLIVLPNEGVTPP